MGEIVRLPPLVFPTHVQTFDCNEIAYVQNLGGGSAKFWFAGTMPTVEGTKMASHRLVKVAMIWPIDAIAKAARMSEAAAASFALLKVDDFMGEPRGHA